MSKLKIVSLVSVVVLAALVGGFYGYTRLKGSGTFGAANGPINSSFSTSTDSYLNYGTQDVVGTHIGTSTIGVAFPTINVTNTYVSDIGSANRAVYQIKITAATTTQNNTDFTVQGSNDYLCATQAGNASSTTDVVQSNINWYDAMTFLTNRVHPTSYGSGSTTLVEAWTNATVGSTNVLSLENLNFKCLRFSISASSTAVYVGLNTKN